MKKVNMLLAFAVGTGVGLATGILTAPRSGKKTREMIGNEVNDTAKNLEAAAQSKLDEARKLINNSAKRVETKAKRIYDEVTS